MHKQTQKILSILLFLGLCPLSNLFAQSVSLEYNTLAGTKNQLPFWLWANQLGQFEKNSSTIQNLSLNAFHEQRLGESDFNIEAGLDLDLLLADQNDMRFTQLFGSISWKFLQLQIGAFPEKEVHAGLSTTNGNLAASRNARPHPRIRFGFNRFIPVFFDWFSLNGFYEEGLLNDNRYVEDTHLHRKAFYFRFGNPRSIEITGGVEHFIMWGGTHPVYGEFKGWDSYFDYMFGSDGDENTLLENQNNLVGNGYGVYQLQIRKDWNKLHATFYLSHPFEDRSGMELENYADNLLGLHFAFQKEHPFLENLVLEFFNTKNQSGPYHLVVGDDGKGHGRGRDDYYNHGIYFSGVTFHQMSMASPVFATVIVEDGISKGFESTRLSGFHLGFDGSISQTFHWKAKYTYSNNYGQHNGLDGSTYNPSRKQASAMGELSWNPQEKKIEISATIAADHGTLYDNGISTTRLGAMVSFKYHFN
ncbi:capsule assembly Wzi family protein [Draconibacterium halophilum]|uniref:Capsule assembly Wzi family protein n=1 Tax=Draconibacterium halophilum TaxID=2706887 RepID=A0A6C0RGA1_9BACT|nr:capsule assembly Wzi family protein [Draconibacterium halophilum]QIA08553.1 capsule assembly Wzi family protein [Draconibacterium halophilum]